MKLQIKRCDYSFDKSLYFIYVDDKCTGYDYDSQEAAMQALKRDFGGVLINQETVFEIEINGVVV